MTTEPCSACQTAAWYKWYDAEVLAGRRQPCWAPPETAPPHPRICDTCRERLKRIAAQYQPKEAT